MGSLGPELMPDSDGVPPFNRQRLDVLSNRPLPLVLASCGEPSIMRHSILVLVPRFQLLVFRFLVSRSSLSVTRFHLLVFRSRVPRSSLSVRYHGVIVAVDLYVFLIFYSFVYSSVSWLLLSLFVPPSRRHDVHLLLMSRMGSG
jgi:hypothetical protein